VVFGVFEKGSAAASQVGKPEVVDSRSLQRGLECRLLILRLLSRAREAPDIRDDLDPICRQDCKKIDDGAG
jgi:hypothetical protein